jgi:hypothetical protein
LRSEHCQSLDDYKFRFDFLATVSKRVQGSVSEITIQSAQDALEHVKSYCEEEVKPQEDDTHLQMRENILTIMHQEAAGGLTED